jgi:hypothetical protein
MRVKPLLVMTACSQPARVLVFFASGFTALRGPLTFGNLPKKKGCRQPFFQRGKSSF